MGDLIERLRADEWASNATLRREAADEIERLNCALVISRGKHENAIAEIERLTGEVDSYRTDCEECYAEIERLQAWCEQTNPDAYEKWSAVQAEFKRLRAALETDDVESNNA